MSIYYIDNSKNNLQDDFDIDKHDHTLNGSDQSSFRNTIWFNLNKFNQLFFSQYGIEYISDYFTKKGLELRVVSHPKKTNTCYEKAMLLDSWDPLNVIKALYFECSADGLLYGVVVPETGCFMDKKKLSQLLGLPEKVYIAKAKVLPEHMTFGTCSPFINKTDLIEHGGKVKNIIFDTETLVTKKYDNSIDDFSFGLDHRLSMQMNYYHCYKMLKKLYGDVIVDKEILSLSFKGKFIRAKGRIKINYEFNTLNYRTAKFINNIHGYSDISIVNDFIDELDLPDILTTLNGNTLNNLRTRD